MAATSCVGTFAAQIEGAVVDDAGNPIHGALVAATSKPAELDHGGAVVKHLARTDDHGHFLLSELKEGVYGVTATAANAGAGYAGPLRLEKSDDRVTARVVLEQAGLALSGSIRPVDGLQPRDMVVAITALDDRPGARFYADASDGRYDVGLPAGEYVAVVVAPGWRSIPHHLPAKAASRTEDFRLFRDPPSDPALRAELRAMATEDQRVRLTPGAPTPDEIALIRDADKKNQARLNDILLQHGWPGASQVGADGVEATWMMLQHGPADALKRWLPAMRTAVDSGELPPADWALSVDRDRVHDGRPQLFGSQGLPLKNGRFQGLRPIEDPTHVDERRAALGMEPLADYEASLAKDYGE